MSTDRSAVTQAKRWVVKIGSALLTDDGRGLDHQAIAGWVDQLVNLQDRGIEIVLVSSGAIAEGMSRLGWDARPREVHKLQAAAAVGQMGLVQAYESQFQRTGRHTAQILLDHDDLSNRERYLNARRSITYLLKLGVVPVVNENDTVVTDEIRFGDNDTLGALVANLLDAQVLVILTDRAGLLEADPRTNPDAAVISQARADDDSLDAIAGGSNSQLGRGGMVTKLQAARLAARSGAHTIIAGGRESDILTRLADGEMLGTLLVADSEPLAARKQWLAGHMQVNGTLTLDEGAVKVLRESGKSLLPVGVKHSEGSYTRGDIVRCISAVDGREIARGLVNYNSDETAKIIGLASKRIEDVLGYGGDDELIHRDNLVLV
ncbi:MAG: glutamate 5-kinase [Porticoccaceae bacterium]